MITVTKSVIVPYTIEQMFKLVVNIADYPKYLPWCTASTIQTQTPAETVATVYIEYFKIKTHFTTRNMNTTFTKIEMFLIDGPFKKLFGCWNFIPLGEHGCKIDFKLEYKFLNVVVGKIIGPAFNHISQNIINCFIAEARKQYG